MTDLVIRQRDSHGSGKYRASRGRRLHNGLDIACVAGEPVFALAPGRVTKIGFPYSAKNKLFYRYVQVTDDAQLDVRYFYVSPTVGIGDRIEKGAAIGVSQGLDKTYPGITQHIHFEVLAKVNGKKVFADPEQYLKAHRHQWHDGEAQT